MKRGFALFLLLTSLAAACGSADDRIVVAAGTTLVDSGLLERVLAEYPGDQQVSVVGVSSREALALGAAGSAQVLITHHPEAEAEYLSEHPAAREAPVFTSEFIVVGPGELAADTVVDVFREIAAAHSFVSRADGSGTAAKEREIWDLAGIDPIAEPWYSETGQGMGFTLQVADQRKAYTLAEIGTFVAAETLTLEPIEAADDGLLDNPYRVTLVPDAGDGAEELFEWLTGPEAIPVITAANFELFGRVLYAPTVPEPQS